MGLCASRLVFLRPWTAHSTSALQPSLVTTVNPCVVHKSGTFCTDCYKSKLLHCVACIT